jgi:hypothetical protein
LEPKHPPVPGSKMTVENIIAKPGMACFSEFTAIWECCQQRDGTAGQLHLHMAFSKDERPTSNAE